MRIRGDDMPVDQDSNVLINLNGMDNRCMTFIKLVASFSRESHKAFVHGCQAHCIEKQADGH